MHSHLVNTLRRQAMRLLPAALFAAGLAACAAPPPPPADTPVAAVAVTPAAERSIVLTVNFDFDSYRIRPESYVLLDNTAAAMTDSRLAGSRFEINGHTDIIGTLGYNIALSQLRADAVRAYLAARGVPLDSMRAQGFGPLQLLDSYNPRSPANRRVEIVAFR